MTPVRVSRRARALATCAVVLGAATMLSPATGAAQSTGGTTVTRPTHQGGGLRVVGRSDLGGKGLNGDLAVVGTTAVVAAGLVAGGPFHAGFYNPITCPDVSVKVVDLTDPAAPRVASTIPVPPGVVALDVAALRVDTPAFSGDLAALALSTCSAVGSGVEKGVHYYDVSNSAAPVFLGRYQAGAESVPANAGPCAPATPTRCAASIHSVQLVARADGRVLSLSSSPGGSTTALSGDLRIVDATNPRAPVQIGSFPALGQRPAGGSGFFSPTGCRTFYAGHDAAANADGTRALMAYLDEGVFAADLANPATPAIAGRFEYPKERTLEAGAGYVAWAEFAGRQLGLVSEEDWIAPSSSVRIDAPASLAGSKFACESVFTLFDPENTAQVYRKTNSQVPGEMVYVGRGCPVAGSITVADPYLANPSGKIALVDRNPTLQTGLSTGICSFSDRTLRAQQAGATGVIFLDTAAFPSFSPDGAPTGIEIPAFIVEKPDADALRSAQCPTYSGGPGGTCTGGQQIAGAMVDKPGEWGGLRVLDVANPAAPTSTGIYRTPRSQVFPPPDLGVYSVHHAIARGSRAYAAWNSDGVRVLDLTTPTPTEIASFVPADTPDPNNSIPAKAFVTGVDTMPGYVVISDINSGLFVLEFGAGYWTAAADGGVFAFGASDFYGSMGATRLNKPIVGMASTPTGKGYWLVASDGGVFAFGDATFRGSTGGIPLNRPIVGMAPTPSGLGYWLVASDGGVFAFGDARFRGSTGALTLNSPMVGMSPSPSGQGYWLVAADGGIFAFGDAAFAGSTGALKLNRPVVGMAASASGRGYWLVASDGGVFAFGDARFAGSTGAIRLNSPMVGLQSTPTGKGYWMTASDGGIFAFGDATFLGSTGAIRLNSPVVGLAVFPR